MRLKGLKSVEKIYFIGIGGISMSALACFLFDCGYSVSGSDAARSEQTEKLSAQGIPVFVGADENRAELAVADLVV